MGTRIRHLIEGLILSAWEIFSPRLPETVNDEPSLRNRSNKGGLS